MDQPPLAAVIFDSDGTLVDSNDLHVRAWLAALEEHGHKIGKDRVEREIGKGGDQLVEDLLGEAIENDHGDALRDSQSKHAMALIEIEGAHAFPGANELLADVRGRGLKTVLATSSSAEIVKALLERAKINGDSLDLIVNGDNVQSTKPEGDLYHVGMKRLGVSPAECVNVGDTPYDCIAGRKAGLVTIGLSGQLNDSETLRRGGARETCSDLVELRENLDRLLKAACPRTIRLTSAAMEQLMQHALAMAAEGMQQGEVPIGAVIANGSGEIVGRGFNRMAGSRDKIAHAEIVAFRDAVGKFDLAARDLILVSTLEPCVMCLGAAMEAGIETILFGLPAPADGGSGRVTPPTSPESQMPRILGGIAADRSRALFVQWLAKNPDSEQASFVRQLLQLTK